MAKKKKEETLSLENILFNCRDYLRSNATLNDKRDLLLTLVFLRFIGEKFEEAQERLRQNFINSGVTDETTPYDSTILKPMAGQHSCQRKPDGTSSWKRQARNLIVLLMMLYRL